jgi:hypothetical protein
LRLAIEVAGSALASLNSWTRCLARPVGSTGRIGELEFGGGGAGPEDAGVGELDSSLGGLYEPPTTTPLTYTSIVSLSASGTEEVRTPLVDGEGFGGDELRVSSGYVHGIVASEEKSRPGAVSEKMSGAARLGEDHDGVTDDGVGWGGLDEVRKIERMSCCFFQVLPISTSSPRR